MCKYNIWNFLKYDLINIHQTLLILTSLAFHIYSKNLNYYNPTIKRFCSHPQCGNLSSWNWLNLGLKVMVEKIIITSKTMSRVSENVFYLSFMNTNLASSFNYVFHSLPNLKERQTVRFFAVIYSCNDFNILPRLAFPLNLVS